MEFIRLSWLAGTVFALIAAAQPRFNPPVISQMEGKVYVEEKALIEPSALLDGSVVRTAEAGRVEIRLRGGVLYVGENSSVRILDNRPYNFNQLEVLSGSAVLVTDSDGSGLAAVCEDSVKLSDAGVFRFDLRSIPESPYGERDCRFRVYKGAASVQLATLPVVLTSGKTMHLNRRCGDMIPTQQFNTEDIDGLDRWSRERTGAVARRQ
ncbi:MAG: hypothetical protein ABI759_16040 [Candidatus Solibacter sp.]